jgi:hypothetical protein
MSELKHLGVGIVVADKNNNSKHIGVYLPESFPYHEGNITAAAKEITRTITDHHGEETENTVYKKMIVKAEWKGEANDLFAPKVKAGQQVDVFEIDGTNVYFWKELGRDNHLKRLEKAGKAYNASNAKVTTAESLTKENTYGWVVDAENQLIQFWTSMANGERAAFTFEYDGKEGIMKAGDGSNSIQLDLQSGKFNVLTESGTGLELKKGKVKVFAAEEITFETKNCYVKAEKLIVEGDGEIKGDLKVGGTIEAETFTGTEAFIGDVSGYIRA